MLLQYAELHCLSNFTFLRGASHPEELVSQASRLGYSALAITDECSVAGVVRAHLEAKKTGLKLILGSEFKLDDGLRLVLLAENIEGYGNLCELITRARRRAPKGRYKLTRKDLQGDLDHCLALWLPDKTHSCGNTQHDNCRPECEPDSALEQARWINTTFPERAWIAVELHRGADDDLQLAQLTALSAATGLPLVAAGDVHMHIRKRKPLQDVLTAIRLGVQVTNAGSALHPNSERYLRNLGRLEKLYPPALLFETLNIARRCHFSLDEIRYEYPVELVPPGETPDTHLHKLTYEGAAERYPQGLPAKVEKLLEKELVLIAELGYASFFLTIHDIVNYARDKKILCQGRGSAANSAVCYCLKITAVDPDRIETLFERFISKERHEPPDIDVDFEHQRREEVMQYIFRRYGRERTAIAATVIRYRPKSALRDVGKALGFSLDQIDKLTSSLAWWDGAAERRKRLLEAGFDPQSPAVRQLHVLTDTLIGFPRHLSQHVGGFVIDNRKLTRLVPIENATMADRTVIQWDKDDLEALGLLKVDVLALGMLSCIRRTFELIRAYDGTELHMHSIPEGDAAVYDMLCRADSVGVFQVESRAQMSMLPRLRPTCYYDLVVQIAIVRPGPITGGMVHPYLRRRNNEEKTDYPPALKHVLERTLGVTIFQEQVMQIAVDAAGFTPGEADQLRRAMAAWQRKGGLEPFRQRLIDGMLKRGYTEEFAEQIYQMARGFGEYGFPESHSASFALLAYVSSWLKYHHPAAFCAGLLNSQPLGFYSPSQLVQDAKRHGVEVRPVDVTASEWLSALEPGDDGKAALRLGLHMIRGLNESSGQRIVQMRQVSPFIDSADFFRRTQLDRRELNCLSEANALVALSGHRRMALWQTLGTAPHDVPLPVNERRETRALLMAPTEKENISADYRRLGFTLGRHPLAVLRDKLTRFRLATAHEVNNAEHRQAIYTAGIVTCRQRPGTAGGVIFVTLEDETGNINVVVWNSLIERQRRELLDSKLLGVHGVVERKGGVVHLVAGKLIDHSSLLGKLNVISRDFH
ncbi:MAG: error-prone DNA polymerase [Pseudomonadota bacterium]|nr:error-prone DNA polymerase [Pseudomonadota bacterium]